MGDWLKKNRQPITLKVKNSTICNVFIVKHLAEILSKKYFAKLVKIIINTSFVFTSKVRCNLLEPGKTLPSFQIQILIIRLLNILQLQSYKNSLYNLNCCRESLYYV